MSTNLHARQAEFLLDPVTVFNLQADADDNAGEIESTAFAEIPSFHVPQPDGSQPTCRMVQKPQFRVLF